MGLIECFIEIMIFMRGSMSMENLKDLQEQNGLHSIKNVNIIYNEIN